MGAPLYLSNNGLGRAYGIELLLRRQLMRGLYGWVAYSLSRAERRDDPTEYGYPNWRLYEFDQTHILTVIASYQTEHNWTFGTRLRYTSGDPFTPFVNGIFNANNGSYVCIPGESRHRAGAGVLPGRRARRPPLGLTTSGSSPVTSTSKTSPTGRTRRRSSRTTIARATPR